MAVVSLSVRRHAPIPLCRIAHRGEGKPVRARALPCDDSCRSRAMPRRNARTEPFDPERFLSSSGASRKIVGYPPASVIFAQGDPCATVMYIQTGAVKLSV